MIPKLKTVNSHFRNDFPYLKFTESYATYEPYTDGYEGTELKKRGKSKDLTSKNFEKDFRIFSASDNIWKTRAVTSESLRRSMAKDAMNFDSKNKFAIKIDNPIQ